MNEERPEMSPPKINFTWDVNLGAVLQMATVISATITVTVIGIKFWYDTEAGIKKAAAFQVTAEPILRDLVKSDDVQNFKIDSLSGAIEELRSGSRENTQKLNDIASNVSEIKGKLSVSAPIKGSN